MRCAKGFFTIVAFLFFSAIVSAQESESFTDEGKIVKYENSGTTSDTVLFKEYTKYVIDSVPERVFRLATEVLLEKTVLAENYG